MPFEPIYPWAIVYPCHPTNCYSYLTRPDAPGLPAKPKGMVLHTPEEPADNAPGTPGWFATYHADPDARGSTYYFVSYQLDPRRPGFTNVYRCVDERDGAIANGVTPGKPYPSWADRGMSLNWQSDNIEIEGEAGKIGLTLNVGVQGRAQFRSLVDVIAFSGRRWGYPTDREHIIGHYQVSNQRTDPGAGFPWDTLINAFKEDEMIAINGLSAWYGDPAHQKFTGQKGINASLDFNVPSEAVAIELEVFTQRGSASIRVYNGEDGAGKTGLYAFQCESLVDAPDYAKGRVGLSAPDGNGHRWCYMSSAGAAGLRNVGIVGYYLS
jgi:hypothetical protein